MKTKKCKIVGIGGISRSGKSTLASQIVKELRHCNTYIINMDDYVFSSAQIPKIAELPNWEHPESINYSKIISEINSKQVHYDIILVEGHLAFANDELFKLYDTTIFLEVSKETFYTRRLKETRWGQEPNWYLDHVVYSYQLFGNLSNPDLVISGEKPLSTSTMEEIVSKINGICTPSII